MLPRLTASLPAAEVKITCRPGDVRSADGRSADGRSAAGRERSYIGSLHCHERVTLTAAVPRITGAAAVVMRIFSDGGGENNYRDLPFTYSVGNGVTDTYTLDFGPDELSREAAGLYFYEFLFLRGMDTLFSDTKNNVDFTLARASCGRFRLLVYQDGFKTPEWLGGGVMYHIFVDRFCRGEGKTELHGDAALDPDWSTGVPQYAERPGSPVKNNVFFGGNLWGVRERLPYLVSLGVSVIYLSPIFTAASNHKYDTADYLHVDPEFGGDEAFAALLGSAHAVGIRVILDGVFNHTGDDSIYFDRYRRFGGGAWGDPASPYRRWFFFKAPQGGEKSAGETYESWWGIEILPKLDLGEPSCRDFFLGDGGVCEKYLRMGADGWRLDVADELPDDFLYELRERVKSTVPDAAIIGEVWENAADKISYGKRRSYFCGRQLDSVMNYPLRSALMGFAEHGDAGLLADELKDIYSSYPRPAADVLMNIVGTHDTARILTILGAPDKAREAELLSNEGRRATRLSAEEREVGLRRLMVISALQYSVYGFPCLYYGDERGMEGLGDPFCRYPMIWDDRTEAELVRHYARLAEVRREPAFDRGDFEILRVEGGYIEFLREKKTPNGTSRVRVAANLGDVDVTMKADGCWKELYSGASGSGDVRVAPFGFAFIAQDDEIKEKDENV